MHRKLDSEKEYREMHPIELFKEMVIKRPNGVIIRVHALGTAQLNPAIGIIRSETLPSGRTKNDYVSFFSEEFEELFNYLKDTREHWQSEG